MVKFIKTTTKDNDVQYVNVDKVLLISPIKGDGSNKFSTTYRIVLEDGTYQDKLTIEKDIIKELHLVG